MALAVGVCAINPIIDPVIMLTGNNYVETSWPVLVQLASLILGSVLFAYAVLRHRVVDLGFVINRALVFSTLSFLLLLSFGVVEWASEKVLPFESHEVGLVINMVVALSLYLGFHRLREWIEHGVENLFFRAWRARSQALEQFLHQAAYITRPDVLMQRSIAALQSFSGQDEVAFYRHEAGVYALKAGGHFMLSDALDMNEPALVALRADRDLVRDAFMTGTLVIPTLHRAEVTGFVVMGTRRDGEAYRPDEEEELSAAVRGIGQDLHALRIEELERENAALSSRLLALT
jgi:hypothetical protein